MRASLPPPLYSFVVEVFSYASTAATTIIRLTAYLINKDLSEWDAQTLLPPIITLIAAYLALASLYRTASWAIRLTLFFLKWGCLIGIAMGLVGYYAGNGAANQGDEGFLGNVISSVFGGASSSKHNRQTKPRRATQKAKPKPWDSFQEWQYRDQVEDPTINPHAQQVMESIVNAAGLALEGNWWSTITKLGQSGPAEVSVEEAKGKVGKTRSR